MTPKQFRKYLDRDKHCLHCGSTGDDLVPQHRSGRGMGGSKRLDKPSNVIVLCAAANGRLEADAEFAELGRMFGWKLSRYDEPAETLVYDAWRGVWMKLDDNFGRVEIIGFGKSDT